MVLVDNYKFPSKDIDISLKEISYCISIPECIESNRVRLTPFIFSVHGDVFFSAFEATQELSRYLPYTSFRAFVDSMHVDPNAVLFAIVDKTKLREGGLRGYLAWIIGFIRSQSRDRNLTYSHPSIVPAYVYYDKCDRYYAQVLSESPIGGWPWI
ncbi:hypothetical protein BDZ94DRAFT_841353 [Collybia nuda]|uniref:Uncharacterized protein n=1 Tax=Collybia nuda TaxID=64659 RepID=A0A9P6CIW6_9AGAR|nr:hypothetical protein BDZ94DRAFT_841353 [Collybia nuda]